MPEDTLRRYADQAALDARLMFQRMLAGWARDVLVLRRRGLDRPAYLGFDEDPAIGPANSPARPGAAYPDEDYFCGD